MPDNVKLEEDDDVHDVDKNSHAQVEWGISIGHPSGDDFLGQTIITDDDAFISHWPSELLVVSKYLRTVILC